MSRRLWVIGLCLLVVGGCKKEEVADKKAATREEKRKQDCDRFATEMARTAMLTGQMLVTALDDDPVGSSAKQGRAEMKAEAKKIQRDLFDKCLTWPDEVMECLPPLGTLKQGCPERLIAAMEGATPTPKEIPTGPELSWTFTFESQPRALQVLEDGTLLGIAGVESNGIVALREGKVAWRKEGDFAPWLVPMGDGTWVAAERGELMAFEGGSGAVRWTASLPKDAADEDDWAPEPSVKVATRAGKGLWVGDDQARFFVVDPQQCGAAPTGTPSEGSCIESRGRLEDEYLDSDARLFVDGNDRRYLWEDGMVRAFAKDWRPLGTLRAHDHLGHVTMAEGRLVMVIDDDVVELDPTQCRGEGPFAVSGWPQPGALIIGDMDECEECRPPPPGCRKWRAFVADVDNESPALLDDGTVVVNDDSFTHGLNQGATTWKIALGGGGPLVTDGARVFGFSTGVAEDDPPAVFEVVGATGAPRWRTPLPVEPGELYFSDDVQIALAGRWLAVSFEHTVGVLKIPPG